MVILLLLTCSPCRAILPIDSSLLLGKKKKKAQRTAISKAYCQHRISSDFTGKPSHIPPLPHASRGMHTGIISCTAAGRIAALPGTPSPQPPEGPAMGWAAGKAGAWQEWNICSIYIPAFASNTQKKMQALFVSLQLPFQKLSTAETNIFKCWSITVKFLPPPTGIV